MRENEYKNILQTKIPSFRWDFLEKILIILYTKYTLVYIFL